MVARLALRSSSRIVLSAALGLLRLGLQGWLQGLRSRGGGQELEVELSRAEPGAWAESGQGPSRARSRDAGGLDLGLGLEGLYWKLAKMSGVFVAIGCIVYECLEHWLDIYAAVMLSDNLVIAKSVC